MIVIAGHSFTKREKRDATVVALSDMVARARKQDGCFDLSISPDSVDPERINVFECWRDERSWKAWRRIAKPPRVTLRDPQVRLFRCNEAEEL